jgi:putative SOS response-associated peptidase YedK
MCGRFAQRRPPAEVARLFKTKGATPNVGARFNVAPTTDVLAIAYDRTKAERRMGTLRWGLIPAWAKDSKIAMSLINAKAETLREKPSFREAFARRRCIIPADAFYEWKVEGKAKQAFAAVRRDGAPLAFAGLWERWRDGASGELIRTCTIVTTQANATCAPIHHRMPVILADDAQARWLGEDETTLDELSALLTPFPAEAMEVYPVDARVGNARNDDERLLERVAV